MTKGSIHQEDKVVNLYAPNGGCPTSQSKLHLIGSEIEPDKMTLCHATGIPGSGSGWSQQKSMDARANSTAEERMCVLADVYRAQGVPTAAPDTFSSSYGTFSGTDQIRATKQVPTNYQLVWEVLLSMCGFYWLMNKELL